MPPAIAAVVISIAATSVGGVIAGAVIGAVIGAGIAMATGGDVQKGALNGAITGVGAVVIGGLTAGTGSASVGEAGAETVGTGQLAVDLETGATSAVPSTATSGLPAATNAAAATQGSQGILSKASNWIETHPKVADIAARTVSGAAEAMLIEDENKRTIEALMERDRLNREALKIRGLADIDTRSVLPSIGGFLERPKWEMSVDQPTLGILNQETKKA